MSVLRKVEKVERVLFQPYVDEDKIKCKVSNVVLTGKKIKDSKADIFYKKTYDSQKYSDCSRLESIEFSTKDFIVFSFSDFSRINSKDITEEVYCSYPHMNSLRIFIKQCLDMVENNTIFNKKSNKMNMDHKEDVIVSDPMATGKILYAYPCNVDYDDNKVGRGILLCMNSDDNYVQLDEVAVDTLYEYLYSVDLMMLSSSTLMASMLSLGGTSSSEVDEDSTPSGEQARPFRGRGGNPRKRRGPGNSGETPNPNTRKARGSKKDEETEIEEADEEIFEEDIDDIEEEEVETPKKPVKKNTTIPKKTTKKATPKRSMKMASLDDVMEEADNIEMDEEDLDFDEED